MGYAPKLSSGIDLIDETWGGLYEGGSYLVYGRSASNRDLIPLLFAAHGGAEPCLYLSSDSPSDMALRAQSHGIDLRGGGSVNILQLPRIADSTEVGDDQLTSALSDVVSQVERAHPQRVVIDDFMPFVAFHSYDRFRSGFVDLLERIDAVDSTLMLTMAAPANDEAETVIEFMRNQMTGALHILRPDDEERATMCRVAFHPNIGHAGLEGEREWDVRSWILPSGLHDRSGRRFRFSEEAGPSPRQARWTKPDRHTRANDAAPATEREGSAADHRSDPSARPHRPARPIIPPIRLGADVPDPSTPEPSFTERSTHVRADSSHRRIPRIPLGRADELPQRPAEADLGRERGPEQAHPMQGAARPTTKGPAFRPVALAESAHYRTSHTDREAFRTRLQKEFLRHNIDHTPFVLIAMRMVRPGVTEGRPFDFDFILDLVTESLRDQDDVFVDLDRERLIVMLAESGADASPPFFGRLKQRLREEAPRQADALMQSVSAIVVPNGRPFRTAEEFLTYAMDED